MKNPTLRLTPQSLLKLDRLGALALSPRGDQAVASVSQIDLKANRLRSNLWLLPLDQGTPRLLTTGGLKDGAPAFSPDGLQLAFTSEREQEGQSDTRPQLYLLPLAGGEARRISDYEPGVGAFRWMPDGQRIVFISWVWPNLRGAKAQSRRHRETRQQQATGLVTQEAQYRYWSANLPQDRVAHLHLLDLRTGKVIDLFEGTPYELPRDEPGLANFDISPDGRELAFTHDPAPVKAGGQRWELVKLTLRGRRFERLTERTDWDFSAPRYSPCGTQIAAIATPVQRRDVPFAHASIGRLAVWPQVRRFRASDARPWHLDPQPHLQWEADGHALWFAAEERGRCHAWRHD
ncbi:MAG: TolB family protein, partial [Betaproteobacteria bacterium]